MQTPEDHITLGRYVGRRLKDLGVTTFFTVPGDYTMSLLDQLLAEDLQGFGCCNELNAGYAADGYTRLSGKIGVLVVTYMVGALSALNAVAGAAAADLPLLVIVGGPNSHATAGRRMVHHAIDTDLDRCARCFEPIVSDTFKVFNIQEGQHKVDQAILSCLMKKKPVYLELACNVVMDRCSPPTHITNLVNVVRQQSDEVSLNTAAEEITRVLNHSSNVVVVVGSKVHGLQELHAVQALVQKLCCAVVVMPDAKGLYPETNNEFLGCYWGEISSPGVQEMVEKQADALIFIGPIFTDYNTVGWSAKYPVHKKIVLNTDNVHLHSVGKRFSYVNLLDILSKLVEVAPSKDMQILKQFQDHCHHACMAQHTQQPSHGKVFQQHIQGTPISASIPQQLPQQQPQQQQVNLQESLSIAALQKMISEGISSTNTSVIVAETGDSWFITKNLKLPSPTISFQAQMQYGSIGWALGAVVGMGKYCQEEHLGRIVAFIGDGSFQVSAQELSTLIAQNVNATIILLNNCSYSIENQIHPGPYNDLQCWDYVKFLESVAGKHVKQYQATGKHAYTNEEFQNALRQANEHHGVFLIDCHISKTDCTAELHHWGHKLAAVTMKH